MQSDGLYYMNTGVQSEECCGRMLTLMYSKIIKRTKGDGGVMQLAEN